jgi:hypothetical protein
MATDRYAFHTLALIVWYLMVPPIKHGGYDSGAPLRQWSRLSQYDSPGGCEEQKALNLVHCGAGKCELVLEMMSNSRCVSTDDPRLAK